MRIKSQTLLCTVLLLLLAQCGWAQFQMRVKGTGVSLGIVPKQYPLTVKWKPATEAEYKQEITIYSFGQKLALVKEGVEFDIQIDSKDIYGFAANPDSKNIVNVLQWGDTKWQTLEYAFAGSDVAGFFAAGSPDLSECWSMEGTFQDCKKFNDPKVAGWDVTHVRNMRNTFKNAEAFNQDLAGWQVQGVNDMSGMFMNAKAFGYELKKWAGRVGNVVSMENTFTGATAFNANLGLWKLRNVKKIGISNSGISDKNYAYALQCWVVMGLKDVELSAIGCYYGGALKARTTLIETNGWKISGDYGESDATVTNPFIMHVVATSASPIKIPVYGRGMKISCKNLENVSEHHFVKSGVTVTSSTDVLAIAPTAGKVYEIVVEPKGVFAFKGNEVGHPFTIKQWGDVKWKTMNRMFAGANVAIAKEAGIPVMDEVEDCSYMFEGCAAFNSDISSWNVSNVKNMSHMFDGCKNFNTPLNKWDVAKVKNMSGMFKGCETFNQLINSWNVEAVEDFSNMFEGCKEYNKPLIGWKPAAAVNMSAMFKGCEKFNQPINTWETNNVKNLSEFLSGCKLFNQPIENLNVENVTSFANVFNGASSFNQTLGAWKLRRVAALDLSNTNLNSENYTKTLIAWGAQENICTDLKLIAKANIEYKKEAFDARKKLVVEKKWTISSDKAEQVISSNNSFLEVEKSFYYIYKGTDKVITVTPRGQFAKNASQINSEVKCNVPEKDKAKVTCTHIFDGTKFILTLNATDEVEGKVSFIVKRKVDEKTGEVIVPDYELSFGFKAIEEKNIAFTPEMTVVYLRKGEHFELPVALSPDDLKEHQRVPALNLVNDAAEKLDKLVSRVVYDEKEKVRVDLFGFEEGEYTVRMVSAYDPAVKAATFKVVVVPALTKFQLLGDDNITVRANATEDYHIALDMESTSPFSKQVDWSCEPKGIAKVYQNGDFKALAPGFATITLKTFTYPQITKTIHLTVLPAEDLYSVGVDPKLGGTVASYTPMAVAPGGTILVEFNDGIELNGVLKLSDADKNSGAVLNEIIPHKLYSVLMGIKNVTLDGEVKAPKTYTLKAEVKNANGVSINKYYKTGMVEYTTEELGKLKKGDEVTVTLNNSTIQITNLQKKKDTDSDKVSAVHSVYVESENCKVDVVSANQSYKVTIGDGDAHVVFNVNPIDKYVKFSAAAAKPEIKIATKVVSAFYPGSTGFVPPLDRLTQGDVVVVSVLEPLDKVYKATVTGGAELTTLVNNKQYAIRLGAGDASFSIDYDEAAPTYAVDVVDNTGMGFTTNPTELSALAPNTEVTLTVTNSQNVALELMVEGAKYEVKDNNTYVITVGYQNATVVINKVSSLKPNELPAKPENPGINPGGAPGYYPGTAVEDAVFANVVVAPNPFSFMLRVAGVEGRYELISVQGVVLRAGALFETETLVETSDLNAGLYLLRLTATNGATKTFKVVKR